MKNLKRVLSLALSGVMLVGMMAMSASAVNAEDFTDADEITHTEAVSISTALKIIDGKEDGSFDPAGNVTRGQMAKMITRAMFGGEDPVLGLPGTPTFTDIKGRWDESYIEYCANNTIINGRGDGTFDPEGNVTGTEAAKMLLTALGYKADVYGLVGPDWAITTNSIANTNDVALYDGLKGLDPSQPFTRDQVAQMIYNALNAETRQMNPNMSITNGDVTYAYEPSGKTLLFDKYGAVRVEGVVTDNEFSNNADAQKGETDITLSNKEELDEMLGTTNINQTLKIASGKEEFGRNIIAYVKPANSTKTNLSKGTVISDLIIDDVNEVITTAGRFSGSAHTLASWIDNNGMEIASTAKMHTNYATGVTITDAIADAEKNENLGTEYIAIDNNGDGEVEVVLKNTSSFGQITKWDTKNEKVTVASNLVPNADMDDVVIYDDAAKDDWVNVTKVADTYYVTKAETVEGTLDKIKGASARDTLVVDGETYTITGKGGYTTSDVKAVSNLATNPPLDEEITLYLDAFGYVVAFSAATANDFLFVGNASWSDTANTQNSGTLTAYVYMEDGTSGSYTVSKITDSTRTTGGDPVVADADKSDDTKAAASIIGKVWKYALNSKGQLELTQVTNTTTSGSGIAYDKGDMSITNGPASKYIVDDTVVFFVTLDGTSDAKVDKVNVYTGKTSPSVTIATGASAILTGDGFQPALVSVAGSGNKLDAVVFANDQTAGSDWAFIIERVTRNSTGVIYRAIVDGEVVDNLQSNSSTNVANYKQAYDYDMDGDNYALASTQPNDATGLVTDKDGSRLVVGGQEYKITDNTVIALIDGSDSYVGATVEEDDYVYVVYNTDKEAEGIFVLAEADDTDTSILATGAGVTAGTDPADYAVAMSTGDHTQDLVDLFTTQVGVQKVLVKERADVSDSNPSYKPGSATTVGDLKGSYTGKVAIDSDATEVAAGTYFLVIIENGAANDSTSAYSVYELAVTVS